MYEEKKCTHYTINKNMFWIGAIVILLLIAAMLFEIYRLSDSHQTGTTPERIEKTHIEFGSIESKLKDTDNCYLCGLAPESLMGYYRKFDTVGVIGLNEWYVLDLKLQNYDNDGNPIDNSSGSSSSFGNTSGMTYHVDATPTRGMTRATISSTNGSFEPTIIQNNLCQDCLDKITNTLEGYFETGNAEYLPFCLVDFSTLEIYPLQKTIVGYFIRDYWVELDHSEEEVEVKIYYLPER